MSARDPLSTIPSPFDSTFSKWKKETRGLPGKIPVEQIIERKNYNDVKALLLFFSDYVSRVT